MELPVWGWRMFVVYLARARMFLFLVEIDFSGLDLGRDYRVGGRFHHVAMRRISGPLSHFTRCVHTSVSF